MGLCLTFAPPLKKLGHLAGHIQHCSRQNTKITFASADLKERINFMKILGSKNTSLASGDMIIFSSPRKWKSPVLQVSVCTRLTNTELLGCYCCTEWQLHRSDLFLLQMKYGFHRSCQHLMNKKKDTHIHTQKQTVTLSIYFPISCFLESKDHDHRLPYFHPTPNSLAAFSYLCHITMTPLN